MSGLEELRHAIDAAEADLRAAQAVADERYSAWEWVERHGGLDSVKDHWQRDVPRGQLDHAMERAKARRERLIRHAQELEGTIRDRNREVKRLKADNERLRKKVEGMEPRLMPEGMEWLLDVWPKWSNAEYCKFGDWWTADKYGDYEPKQLRRLVFYTPEQLREWEQDEGDNFGYEWDFMRPSDTTYRPDKAEPPAPKVLDADGVEIRVGDTVWDIHTVERMTVDGITGAGGAYETCRVTLESGEQTTCDGPRLTHRAPVLAADGRPLREGETVYDVEDAKCYPHTVASTELDGLGHVKTTCEEPTPASVSIHPSRLTHERPDTWERIEDDAKNVADLWASADINDSMTMGKLVADIVRRCKAMARVSG